jgi:hypothetical protein
MLLYLIAIPTTILLLEDVAGFIQIIDDSVRASFGNTERLRDVAQSDVRVVGDAQERTTVVGKEGPGLHDENLSGDF